MPTLLRWNGARFFFFSNEGNEPPHVHIDKAENSAKIWLHTLAVASNDGFSKQELSRLVIKVGEHREEFLKAWYEFHYGQKQ